MSTVTMQAKFKVQEVSDVKTEYGSSQKLTMAPVNSSAPYGPNGENEDNTFARFTPSGEIRLHVTNPDLKDKIKPGEVYYIDFTKAD